MGEALRKSMAIERWVTAREGSTAHFRWNYRTTALTMVFMIGVPYLMYSGIKNEIVGRRL
eukprot:Clim_evm21s70 gene=Clim_evmTU21s70